MNVSSTPSFLRFSFATDTQRDALLNRLTPGQTLQARVLDQVSEGRWAVRVFGHTLVAESRLSLAKGQVVETRVQDLGPPLTLSILGKPGSEAAAVRDALGRLGVPVDARSEAVIRAMIGRGLPVDRDQVLALRDLVGGVAGAFQGEDLEEIVRRILFLQDRGLPVTPETVSGYLARVPVGALTPLLEGLADLLQGLRGARADQQNSNALTARLRDLVRNASELTPEDVRTTLRDLGLDLEGRMAAVAGRSPDQAALDSLKLDLLRFQALLAGREPASESTARLLSQLSETIRHLDTMQAASLPGRSSGDVVFQLPLAFGAERAAADIRISRDRRQGRTEIDPESTRIVIDLSLAALGPIRVDLAVTRGRTSCTVEAEIAETVDLFEAAAEELAQALIRATSNPSDVRIRRRAEEELGPAPPTVGVDFRA